MEIITVVWKNAPVVAVLLLLISTISLAIFLERFLNVKKSKVLPRNWEQIKIFLINRNYEAAVSSLRKDKRVLSRSLSNLLELFHKGEISKAEFRQLLEAELYLLYQELSKRISFISVSATLATLLGLLGTVIGLIDVFGAYSFTTTEGLRQLSKGIATALNSTGAGLLVAVFTYILYWLVKERVNSVYAKVVKEVETVVELLK
jgi:biopolymer transport protein ExbB